MAASYPYLLSAFPFICLCFISLAKGLGGGFTVELIHRDSSKSPYYNPTETPFQQMTKALHSSIKRAGHFYPAAAISADAATAQAGITPHKGEYLLSYSIGTPPLKVLAIADTASDLIWLQCKPCNKCYNQTSPLFDPSGSTTYESLPCNSQRCQSLEQINSSFCSHDSICQYETAYGDGSSSVGDFALDTISLSSTNGGSVAFPKTLFGCGHNNSGIYDPKESGVIGLGGGEISLINQMGSATGGKFSYCLVPFFSQNVTTSQLNFGENALVSGSGTVSTPIIRGKPDSFYYLSLLAMSVGSKRVEFSGNSSRIEGNIILDSGTTFTLLPPDFYNLLASEVESQVNLERTKDPTGLLDLCYKSDMETFSKQAPTITAHFHGADLKLNPINSFISVSEDVLCFAFSMFWGAIFGNVAQMNFLVGYDLQKNTVSFKPTDCTKM